MADGHGTRQLFQNIGGNEIMLQSGVEVFRDQRNICAVRRSVVDMQAVDGAVADLVHACEFDACGRQIVQMRVEKR